MPSRYSPRARRGGAIFGETMALPALIGGIVKLGTTWLSNRSEKQQARHERDLRVIAGDQSADTAASSAWKHRIKMNF